jgi:hypothetical protein
MAIAESVHLDGILDRIKVPFLVAGTYIADWVAETLGGRTAAPNS